MAEDLLLRVLTPTGKAVEAPVAEVVLPGVEGEFCVLPGHTPYLAVTLSGVLSYSRQGKRRGLALRRGMAEVKEESVTVLTEEACLPEDVDLAEAERREKAARQRLEEALSLGQPTDALEDEVAFVSAQRLLGAAQSG